MRGKNGLLHLLPKQTPLAWCNEISKHIDKYMYRVVALNSMGCHDYFVRGQVIVSQSG